MNSAPRYLSEYASLWNTDPHAANLKWFRQAGYGMFIHFGLYSQLARGEWVQYNEKIPVREYEKLAASFAPERFDADFITDLALEAGMRYVNLTTCHHEGFCLWNSSIEAFNSYAVARRDLVAELAEQCDRKGLGFFTYFTYVLNWRHPSAIAREYLEIGRPDYPSGDPAYNEIDDPRFSRYWQWSHNCLRELCTLPYPVAGIWLDIIIAYYLQPRLIPVEKTYAMIRKLRPEALICFKQGATGTEDFAAPEFHFTSLSQRCVKFGASPSAAELADSVWEINRIKHNEICMTMQEEGWGYVKNTRHKDCKTILANIAYARKNKCNLLINIGPLADGSIHPQDVATLRQVGEEIRRFGIPDADAAEIPKPTNAVAE